jgi:hypothetical protein
MAPVVCITSYVLSGWRKCDPIITIRRHNQGYVLQSKPENARYSCRVAPGKVGGASRPLRQSTMHHASMPPERLATFRCKPAISAGVPPLFSNWRKSERCTATRLIEPSASTSTAFHPDAVLRIT